MNVAANLARKALLHAPLVGWSGVLDAEYHGGVEECSEWRHERCLLLVIDCHFYLVVTKVGVKESQRHQAHGRVDDLIDPREDELLLWAGAIEICVVDTHY